MPLFKRYPRKEDNDDPVMSNNHHKPPSSSEMSNTRTKLVFHCQQAQGSPTGIISGFTNINELYLKISQCYDFPPDDILFCTLNSHKVDMTKLLGGQIGLEDFIFVHRKGRAKEIEITKTEESLGLTITDNGARYAFVKRIKEDSIVDRIPHIQVGDHIESIDDITMVSKRHYEVAKTLKDIPIGTTFVLRLVEPLRAGFANIDSRGSGRMTKKSIGSGRGTLRFKANGQMELSKEPEGVIQVAIDHINKSLDSFLGISDNELATQIWELSDGQVNSIDFAEALEQSELSDFEFTDDFIIELWGVITDARAGRLK